MASNSVELLAADHSVDRNRGDVLIVGGGISGIQASLDLANSGFRVFLVDKSPSIGGKMSLLDKTFPTNDCSMCIESPKFIECSRHPNIEIITYTEVERVSGEAGNFTVSLIKKPRYIIEDKCTGCNICVDYCPVKIPDPFNQGLSANKSVHIYFSQAEPLVTYIDPETCLYLQEGKCQICVGACKTNAIDLHQQPEPFELEVGAILLAPGFDIFNPKLRGDYGYGRMKNVVTSLEFERILCSTGPYEGEIQRPSDLAHPQRIAWIQCVGSRQVIPGGNSYCSAVCCTYTQKQIITPISLPPSSITIFVPMVKISSASTNAPKNSTTCVSSAAMSPLAVKFPKTTMSPFATRPLLRGSRKRSSIWWCCRSG